MLLIFPTVLLGENPMDTLRLRGYAKPTYLNQYIYVNYTIYGNVEGEVFLPEDLGDLRLSHGPIIATSIVEGFKTTTYSYAFHYPRTGFFLLAPAVWKSKSHSKIIKSEPLLLHVLSEYEPIRVLDIKDMSEIVEEVPKPDFDDYFRSVWRQDMRIVCEYPEDIKAGFPFKLRYKLYFEKFNFMIYPIESPNIPLRYVQNISKLPSERKVIREHGDFTITLLECELMYPKIGIQKIPAFSVINLGRKGMYRDTIYCQPCTIQVK